MSAAARTTAEVMLRYAEAMRTGDGQTIRDSYAEDVVLHYAGSNPLSGAHRGWPAMLTAMRELSRRSGRQMLEVVDVMLGEERACFILRERFSRDGETHEVLRTAVYRVVGGSIVECWVYDEDQALMDRLLRD
jgi:ketosteroid isomerase-like protein